MLVWYGMVLCGMLRSVTHGLVNYGMVCYGMMQYGTVSILWYEWVRYGMVRYNDVVGYAVGFCMVWYGMVL